MKSFSKTRLIHFLINDSLSQPNETKIFTAISDAGIYYTKSKLLTLQGNFAILPRSRAVCEWGHIASSLYENVQICKYPKWDHDDNKNCRPCKIQAFTLLFQHILEKQNHVMHKKYYKMKLIFSTTNKDDVNIFWWANRICY